MLQWSFFFMPITINRKISTYFTKLNPSYTQKNFVPVKRPWALDRDEIFRNWELPKIEGWALNGGGALQREITVTGIWVILKLQYFLRTSGYLKNYSIFLNNFFLEEHANKPRLGPTLKMQILCLKIIHFLILRPSCGSDCRVQPRGTEV